MLKVLEPQWLNVAEKFLEKKYPMSVIKNSELFLLYLKIDTPEKHCDFYFDCTILMRCHFIRSCFVDFQTNLILLIN